MSDLRPSLPLSLVLWLAGLGAAAQYGKISVIFDRLPQVYPQAGAALGWTVSMVGVIGIALGLVAGILAARIGLRRALLAGLWAGAAVSLLQASFPPLPVFLALRVVEGVSHLALVVVIPTLIAQLSTDRLRPLMLTVWGTFFGVAFAILVFAGLPLVDRFGMSALFVAHAVYMAGFAMVLHAWVPRDRAGEGQMPGLAALGRDHLRIYRSAHISAPAWGWLFYTFCFVSFLTLVPPFLPEAQRVWVVGAMPLVSIASSLVLGVQLLRVTSPIGVVVLGFGLSAACALALLAAPGNAVLCLTFASALGLVQGASFAAVPQLNTAPDSRAMANGGMAQMGNIGNTLGTPMIAWAITFGGHAAMMLALAAALIAGCLVHLWLAHLRRQGGY
ncbi:MFS transporter [Roseibaca sp. Y0-43]|uniref:MFS transporter n=1 Tax=Roseibaca sp. Y0-43 TaxID=2816854 RepID=UPI001D0C3F8B|nr:MFS transporter [Roseibaca sp. Y0-43]MCC1482088.1 MFS transporter [Roseibaca sp. Y0-43]